MSRSRSTTVALTAEEAVQQAEAEGLTLLKSEICSTGFKCVAFTSGRGSKSKPYQATSWRGGKKVTFGRFTTVEEAALHVARASAAAAAPPEPPPLTAEEALWQAEAEGLTLLRSERGSAGYKNVCFISGRDLAKPYQAKVWRGGRQVLLGYFTTAEEAALSYARTPEAQATAAAPPEPPPLTAEEAVRQAEAEGLTLLRSESSISGYKGVCQRSYKGVYFDRCLNIKPYQAVLRRGGKNVHLGYFATAEEAALCYARTPEAQATQPPPTSSKKRKVTSEEQPPDVPADVVVILEGRLVESTTFEIAWW